MPASIDSGGTGADTVCCAHATPAGSTRQADTVVDAVRSCTDALDKSGEKNASLSSSPLRAGSDGDTPLVPHDPEPHALDGAGSAPESPHLRHPNESAMPWMKGLNVAACVHIAQLINHEFDAFRQYIRSTAHELENRAHFVELVTRSIKSIHGDGASVKAFGSSVTELNYPTGDVDLLLVLPRMKALQKTHKGYYLQEIGKRLRSHGVTQSFHVITTAAVPILTFSTIHGNCEFDISISHEENGEAAKLIIDLLNSGVGPALYTIVLIAKRFLSMHSLNKARSGGLSSYSLTWLVAYFLQTHARIISHQINPSINVGILTMEFFRWAGLTFDFNRGISVRSWSTFDKKEKGWYSNGTKVLLAIENPVDRTRNISQQSSNFPSVRALFAGGFEMMVAAACRCNAAIMSREHSVDTNVPCSPYEMSVLSSIIFIDKKTIEYRERMETMWRDQTIPRLLYPERYISGPGHSVDTDDNIHTSHNRLDRNARTSTSSVAGPSGVSKRPPTVDLEHGTEHSDIEEGRSGKRRRI